MFGKLSVLSMPVILIHTLTRISLSHYWSMFPLIIFGLFLSAAGSARLFLLHKDFRCLFVLLVSLNCAYMMLISEFVREYMTPEFVRAIRDSFCI